MKINFLEEHDKFQKLFKRLPKSLKPTRSSDHIYFVGPYEGEKLDLIISAVIHGNEPGGIVALNKVLEELCFIDSTRGKRIAFVLGNLDAAAKNVRFIEKDLNRTFGETGTKTKEEQIARHIEPILLQSRFVLDLHQTQSATLSDFILTPQKDKNIGFAWALTQNTPIVTHTEEFSIDGLCLDSFVSLNSGHAICFEMGVIGGPAQQYQKATQLCKESLRMPENFKARPKQLLLLEDAFLGGDGHELAPGFINFSPIKKNQLLGRQNNKEVFAKENGFVLFPKYGSAHLASSELCRTARHVDFNVQLNEKSRYE